MKIIEYRVFMPLTVEENQIGQLWSFAEVSRVNTSGGEGVEILQNKSFEVPVNEENKINFKQLPDYENYETQIADSASSSSSTTNQSQTSVKNKIFDH